MIPFNKIKIYKFDMLTQLKRKSNHEYDDYLIICLEKDDGGVWYQFPGIVLWDTDKEYVGKNLGVADPDEQQQIIDIYNTTIRSKSYIKVMSIRIIHNEYSSHAYTDRAIVLSTRGSKVRKGGMAWRYSIIKGQ